MGGFLVFGKTTFPIPFIVALWWTFSNCLWRVISTRRGRWPPNVDPLLEASWSLSCCKQPDKCMKEKRKICFVTHRCLQEEMRQRLKSEIDLTRIGECLLSKNNNRLITCDRTCDKKSWDEGRIDAKHLIAQLSEVDQAKAN